MISAAITSASESRLAARSSWSPTRLRCARSMCSYMQSAALRIARATSCGRRFGHRQRAAQRLPPVAERAGL